MSDPEVSRKRLAALPGVSDADRILRLDRYAGDKPQAAAVPPAQRPQELRDIGRERPAAARQIEKVPYQQPQQHAPQQQRPQQPPHLQPPTQPRPAQTRGPVVQRRPDAPIDPRRVLEPRPALEPRLPAEPKPVHVPRERPPVTVLDEGPLVLVETRKDLGEMRF